MIMNILALLGLYFLVAGIIAGWRMFKGEPMGDWGVAWLPKLIMYGLNKFDEIHDPR